MSGNQCGAVGVPGVLPGISFCRKIKKNTKNVLYIKINVIFALLKQTNVER